MEKGTNKDYSIEKKDQKHLKGISKFIYIVANILKVFAIIGIVGLFIAMIITPIITSNIKTTKSGNETVLNIFDAEIYYSRSKTSIELYEKGKEDNKAKLTSKDGVEVANKILDYLEKNDMTKINLFIETVLIILVIELFIEVIIFKKAHLFFKNIHDESSPFIKENVDLLRSIAKLLIYSLIISIVLSVLNSIVFDSNNSVQITNVIEILIVFSMSYIFEYGYRMQNDTNAKIYSE